MSYAIKQLEESLERNLKKISQSQEDIEEWNKLLSNSIQSLADAKQAAVEIGQAINKLKGETK